MTITGSESASSEQKEKPLDPAVLEQSRDLVELLYAGDMSCALALDLLNSRIGWRLAVSYLANLFAIPTFPKAKDKTVVLSRLMLNRDLFDALAEIAHHNQTGVMAPQRLARI